MKKLIIISCLLFSVNSIFAQQLEHHQGQIIVQLEKDIKADDWIQSLAEIQGQNSGITVNKQLSRPTNIYLLDFDYTNIHEQLMLRMIERKKGLILAQFNHFVEMRAIPNDEQFSSQWQYLNTGQSGGTEGADIDADLAWDVTTGGITISGDTIVVAVLDDGVDFNHEDLQRNLWVNHAEIPNNGMDDDNNGYVDDYRGWSIVTDDDNISGGGHGTPVTGIIGADGNNEIGVTGVNWNVKVMMIKNNFNTNEAQVLSAYSYALEQRMRYNASGGTEGAFVVATNASWGINNGDPDDAPIWCAFYNTLGEAGILSCGATANANINVDEDGDLPTACSSDYLISVTNINHNDMKVGQAGYGLETIDLGAFGSNTFTLTNDNGYGGFGGTSGATPHVAGTIGLLYSLECPTLMALVQADPAAAALFIKNAILNGTDANASLEGITVTGGRLNVMGAINEILPVCDGCLPASSNHLTDVTDVVAQLNWTVNDSLASVDVRWKAVGTEDWIFIENAQSPLMLTPLVACTDYEYQIQSNCFSDTIVFDNSVVFRTDGCCLPPENVDRDFESNTVVTVSWNSVLAAQSYEFAYRIVGTPDWTSVITEATNFTINDLGSCENYEYHVRTICTAETTDWTAIQTFLTQGCGPCLDLEYCIPANIDNSQEYIAHIEIGGLLDNSSMDDDDAYGDYGSLVTFVDLEQGGEYFSRFTPGFPGSTFEEAWRVWIDLDHNGYFTTNEVIFTATASAEPVEGIIQIPADAALGLTRLRVLMKYQTAVASCVFLSGGFGEIEDYCVNIIPTSACLNPSEFATENADSTSITIVWPTIGPAVDYEAAYRLEANTDWIEIATDGSSNIQLSNLDTCANYVLRVKTQCFQEDGNGFEFFNFSTTCFSSTKEIKANAQNWTIAPNPFHESIFLQWNKNGSSEDVMVIIHDAYGRQVQTPQLWSALQNQIRLNLGQLPAGVYTVNLLKNGRLWSAERVIKME